MKVLCSAKPNAAARGGMPAVPLSGLSGRLAALAPQRLAATHAFSLYAGTSEPSGPFSLWPRPTSEPAKAPYHAKKGNKAAPAASELDATPQSLPGKQRFRSALEQVSYFTNQSAFSRE